MMTSLITMMITTMMAFLTTDYYVIGFQEHKVGSTEIKHVNVVIFLNLVCRSSENIFQICFHWLRFF